MALIQMQRSTDNPGLFLTVPILILIFFKHFFALIPRWKGIVIYTVSVYNICSLKLFYNKTFECYYSHHVPFIKNRKIFFSISHIYLHMHIHEFRSNVFHSLSEKTPCFFIIISCKTSDHKWILVTSNVSSIFLSFDVPAILYINVHVYLFDKPICCQSKFTSML
jgi:hypothetical protein